MIFSGFLLNFLLILKSSPIFLRLLTFSLLTTPPNLSRFPSQSSFFDQPLPPFFFFRSHILCIGDRAFSIITLKLMSELLANICSSAPVSFFKHFQTLFNKKKHVNYFLLNYPLICISYLLE